MACSSCETNFQGSQTLVVSVAKSGSRAVLSVGNQGRNIVLIAAPKATLSLENPLCFDCSRSRLCNFGNTRGAVNGRQRGRR